MSEWIERYRDDRWIDAGAFESRWLQPRSYCSQYRGNQSLTTFSTVSKVTPGKIQKRVLCGGFLEKEAQLRWRTMERTDRMMLFITRSINSI